MEAAREGAPKQTQVLKIPFKLVRELSVKMNPEEGIAGNDVPNHSEERRKMTWMREMRIRLFMQMELEASRCKFDWVTKYHDCMSPKWSSR